MEEKKRIPTTITTLGEAKLLSPLAYNRFINDDMRTLFDTYLQPKGKEVVDPISFELSGAREKIYFDPSKTISAIATCGGLCPGLNSVIRSLVMTMHYTYGTKKVFGVRFGLQGFIASYGYDLMALTPENVVDIHKFGGTILGSSRGEQPFDQIVDCLEQNGISVLFVIGGDGSVRAANRIFQEIQNRGLKKSVIAIPKTIDNDIHLVSRSFGFETAVEVATQSIRSAHTEAEGAPNGIGLVRVMGRSSGYIAACAALASKDVNVVLVPEEDFELDGPNGLLEYLKKRIARRGHAVIVTAEGAGQKFFKDTNEKDASGNPKFGNIGQYLSDRIHRYFAELKTPINLKYIDPSYIIRSVPANADDQILCGFLGQQAVHAAMAGKTGMLISNWNNLYVHIPFEAVVSRTKRIDLDGRLWHSVIETTGQPKLESR